MATSNEDEQKPDHRGSEEINRLADHVIEQIRKNEGFALVFIRDVVIVPALVNAYAKGVEIGAEYERKSFFATVGEIRDRADYLETRPNAPSLEGYEEVDGLRAAADFIAKTHGE